MSEQTRILSYRDLLFVVDTLLPERSDREHVAELLQDDRRLLDAMLQDERLFAQLMGGDDALLLVSPRLFFKVLLLRTRRDLERERYTIEHRHLQQVVLFDVDRVSELLARPDMLEYLAGLLASFTRTNSMTVPVRLATGRWYRLRVNDLDVDSLIRYGQLLDEEHRFWAYQRTADACLFLVGLFGEYFEAGRRRALTGGPRPRLSTTQFQDPEDYETCGQTYYRLASRHPLAQTHRLEGVLLTLSEQFILAEKPLQFLANRYLSLRKHHLFDIGS